MFTLCDNLLLRLGAPVDATLGGQLGGIRKSLPSSSSQLGLFVQADSQEGVNRKGGDMDKAEKTGGERVITPVHKPEDGDDEEGAFWEESPAIIEVPLVPQRGTNAESRDARRMSETYWSDSGGDKQESKIGANTHLITVAEECDDSVKEVDLDGKDYKAAITGSLRQRASKATSHNVKVDGNDRDKMKDSNSSSSNSTANRQVLFAAYKVMWSANYKTEALSKLEQFIDTFPKPKLDATTGDDKLEKILQYARKNRDGDVLPKRRTQKGLHTRGIVSMAENAFSSEDVSRREDIDFRVRCHLKRAEWMREIGDAPLSRVLECVMQARHVADDRYSVWHAWAVTNYAYVAIGEKESQSEEKESLITTKLKWTLITGGIR